MVHSSCQALPPLGSSVALDRDVQASEVEAALDADVPAFDGRREAYLKPITQADWAEAREYEEGMRV